MFLSSGDYAYMEAMQQETMVDTCVRVAAVVAVDANGQRSTVYTDAEEFPCGFLGQKYNEAFNQAGQYLDFDAVIRIPRDKWSLFQPNDRVKVKFRGTTAEKLFTISGMVYPGYSATVVGLKGIA